MIFITPEQHAQWVRALGRLPSAQKEDFIACADQMLWVARSRSYPAAGDDDLDALRNIAERAEALASALAYADRLGLPR